MASKYRYLTTIIVFLAICVLAWVFESYFSTQVTKWVDSLILSVVPSIMATGIIAIVFYIVIECAGIIDGPRLEKQLLLNEVKEYKSLGVLAFYPDFNKVPWDDLIKSSHHIDIIVSYYDSWINAHRPALKEFFVNGGEIRIFIGDVNISTVLEATKLRFPDRSEQQLKEKVSKTGSRIMAIRDDAGKGSVSLYYMPFPPNYSSVIFDHEYVALSVYEQFRKDHISSQAILIDAHKHSETKQYWDKEIDGFVKNGKKSNP